METPASLVRWAAPEGPWTEPDLHLFPQDGHRYEIVDGGLHVTPPPRDLHEHTVEGMVTTLRGAAPAGWWVCPRVGVAHRASNLIPDITVLRPQSSGAVWAEPRDVALVVEVESPESARCDALLKPSVYADARIPGFWRVDTAGDLHVYTLIDGAYAEPRVVGATEMVTLPHPYPVRVLPVTWA